jgi:DNA-directed RNA polymerase subunit RPC12/RpoP
MRASSEIKCPICNNKMGEMNLDKAPLSSTLVYTIKNDRRFAKTVVYMCATCRNIQSFLLEVPRTE